MFKILLGQFRVTINLLLAKNTHKIYINNSNNNEKIDLNKWRFDKKNNDV